MKRQLLMVWTVCAIFCVFILSVSDLCAEGENMVKEGGVENVRTRPAMSFSNALKAGWDFGDDIMITLPIFFDQLAGYPGKIVVVEGEPGGNVYQGSKSLYMEGNNSGFYLTVSPQNSKKGERYHMSFWAKGEGKIMVNLVSADDTNAGKACGIVSRSVSISDKWERYDLDFEVIAEATTRIGPSISVIGKAWVDEIFFNKVKD